MYKSLLAAVALISTTAGCMEQSQSQSPQIAELAALPTPSECKVPESVSSANNGLSIAQVTAIWPEGAHGSRGVLERLRTGAASAQDVDYARNCMGITSV